MSIVLTPLRPASERAQSLRFATTCVLLAGLAGAVAFIPHVGFIALSVALLGGFIAYMRFRTSTPTVELFEVIIPFSILYFVYFGIGTVYLVFNPEILAYPSMKPFLAPALAVAVLGYFCFLVGYAWFFRTTRPSPLTNLVPRHILAYVIPTVAGAVGFCVAPLQLTSIMSGGGISPALSFLQQFGVLFFVGWYMAWYMVLSGRVRPSTGAPLLIGLSGVVAIVLLSNFGSKSLAMTVLGMPVMAFYEVKRRVPVKTLIGIALISMFFIFPMFNTFRRTDRSLDTARRLDQTVHLARSWDSDGFLDASVFAVLQRMTLVTSVAAIVADTPRWVDYKYGQTLLLAPVTLLIPRFLWRDKPNISIGREFAATFRLTDSMDMETEVAPSMVGEFYWNFALPGVIVGMFCLGMGYRWFYQRYGAGTTFDPVRKSIYAALLPAALLFEGNFAIIIAGIAKSLLIIVFFFVVLRRIGWVSARPVA